MVSRRGCESTSHGAVSLPSLREDKSAYSSVLMSRIMIRADGYLPYALVLGKSHPGRYQERSCGNAVIMLIVER